MGIGCMQNLTLREVVASREGWLRGNDPEILKEASSGVPGNSAYSSSTRQVMGNVGSGPADSETQPWDTEVRFHSLKEIGV